MSERVRLAIFGSLWTILTLFGGLALGMTAGNVVFNQLPGHEVTAGKIAVAVLPTLAGMMAGSAAWAIGLGRRAAGSGDAKRLAWAGILGFGPIAVAMAMLLLAIEPGLVRMVDAWLPIHRVFTLLFVPSAFLISTVAVYALARAARTLVSPSRLALRVGLIAALAFLIVNLLMDGLGWRVGGPGAAERFTMITVMLAGNVGAALAGGAATALALGAPRRIEQATAAPVIPD